MAGVAVALNRRDAGVGVVAVEAGRVAARRSLERALLEPEAFFGKTFRRLRHELAFRLALRHISLMADGATLRIARLLLARRGGAAERDADEPRAVLSPGAGTVLADKLDVFIVRELDAELGRNRAPERRGVEGLARVGEGPARGEARRNARVAVRADGGRGALAREELLAVTADARRVFGILRDIGEGVLAFPHVLPVRGGELMA